MKVQIRYTTNNSNAVTVAEIVCNTLEEAKEIVTKWDLGAVVYWSWNV